MNYSAHYEHFHPNTPEHNASMCGHFKRELDGILPPDKNVRILDIGCGFGFSLMALRDFGYQNIEGIETSPQQAARATTNGFKVSVADDTATWLAGRNQQFDVIVLFDVLEHLPNDKQIDFLRAIYNSLTPGGRLILTTPNADSILASRWRYIDLTHHTSFTEHSLRFALISGGFHKIEMKAEKGLQRPSFTFWRKLTLAQWRKFLIRWAWLQVHKAEIPWEDISQISFELNHKVVAYKAT